MKSVKIAAPLLLVALLILGALQLFAEVSPKPKPKPADSTRIAKPASPAPSVAATGDHINWVSFDKGVQLQKGTDKHLFVDFTATWCGWCKKMEKETFSDTAVIHYVNKNFIPVKVWGDTDSLLDIDGYKVTQRQLANGEFQVTGYPTFWFVNTKREKLGPVSGYMTKDQLMNILPVVAEYRYDTTRNKQNSTPPDQSQGK